MAPAAFASPAPISKPVAPDACVQHVLAAEKEHNIPAGLMLSISLVESGRNGIPSPLAMSIQGRALYPKTEAEAVRLLRDANGKLRTNTYVGCMQLSVAVHKGGFRQIEKIVSPEANVRYAAKYLVRLRKETGSWAAAIADYNGSSGNRRVTYQCKVQRHMTELGSPAADLIDAKRCNPDRTAEVAPTTRRAFRAAAGLPAS